MPVKKKMVQNLVRQAAKDSEEKVHLLRLAGSKPGLWGGLEEDEVVGVLREVLKKETTGINPAIIKDMITGEELGVSEAIAAHIYQRRWPQIFPEELGMSAHDPRNIVITCMEVEKKLDKGHVCLIPQDNKNIQVKVLKKAMLASKGDERFVRGSPDLMWAQVDG